MAVIDRVALPFLLPIGSLCLGVVAVDFGPPPWAYESQHKFFKRYAILSPMKHVRFAAVLTCSPCLQPATGVLVAVRKRLFAALAAFRSSLPRGEAINTFLGSANEANTKWRGVSDTALMSSGSLTLSGWNWFHECEP